MAYTETGKEKEKREAYYQAKKERGIRAEKQRDYEMCGTTEQNIPAVDVMGNVTGMKKGGKVKKMADGGLSDSEIADKLGRLGLKGGTADYMLGQKQLRSDRTSQGLEELLPSREKIGSALRGKLDPQTVADAANPVGAATRRLVDAAKDVKMPRSYADSSGMKKGGKVSSASKRADGCAVKGKTKGRMV